jgi:hypothetical protein
MKKFFFSLLLLLPLWGYGGLVLSYAAVTITPTGTNYAAKTATFKVSWTGTPYNNRVWIWIDLCPANGAGSYASAVISSATATSGSIVSLTSRGFFVTTNNTTVVATLSNAENKFKWCAYASDAPPNATMANGTYTLKGTPPFKITYNESSSTSTNEKRFTLGCINAISDATGCLGIINYPAFSAGALGVQNETMTYPGNAGEFLNVGGTPITIISATPATGGEGIVMYKWFKNNVEIPGATNATYLPPKADAAVAGTFTYTRKAYDAVCYKDGVTATGNWSNLVGSPASTNTSCSVYVAMFDITETVNWNNAVSRCSSLGTGWRLPTIAEFQDCICPKANSFYGKPGYIRSWTQNAISANPCVGGHYYVAVGFDGTATYNCGYSRSAPTCDTGLRTVRCVKNK